MGKPEPTFSFVNDNALAWFYIYDVFITSISLIESLQCKFIMLNLSVNTVHLREATFINLFRTKKQTAFYTLANKPFDRLNIEMARVYKKKILWHNLSWFLLKTNKVGKK